MGVVYKAHDTRLDRTVALKFLPPHLTKSEEDKLRFIREAKAAAALNHPHICTIYSVEEYDDQQFISMEYVDGATLRPRSGVRDQKSESPQSESRNLKPETALEYALQIAEAIAEAHEKEIIHRDIKPENIMVDSKNRIKVMDFGLAKLKSDMNLTKAGSIVGTVAYMSPEQIQGEDVDHRSDIFSFGVVLYEMLTGRPPFRGEHEAALMYSIVNENAIPISNIIPDVSPALEYLLDKALEKEPDDRYQNMNDLVVDLRRVRKQSSKSVKRSSDQDRFSEKIGTEVNKVDSKQLFQRKPVFISVGLLAFLLISFAAYYFIIQGGNGTATNSEFRPARLIQFTTSGNIGSAAISPDGRYVAYSHSEPGGTGIRVQLRATGNEVQVVPPSLERVRSLMFSPDGNYVYYLSWGIDRGTLFSVSVLGGPVRRLIDDVESSVTLSPDGNLLAFYRGSPQTGEGFLITAEVDGSNQRTILSFVPDTWFTGSPAWSPDGRMIAAGVASYDYNMYSRIFIVRVDDGSYTPLTQPNWGWMSQLGWMKDGSGLLIIGAESMAFQQQLWYVSYPGGEIRRITNDLNNYSNISVTDDGATLCTVQWDRRANLRRVPIAHENDAHRLTSGKDDGIYGIAVTHDEDIIYTGSVGENTVLWFFDSKSGQRRRITPPESFDYDPVVTPDGHQIVFSTSRNGIPGLWKIYIDGTRLQQLTEAENFAADISPNGEWIIYNSWETGPLTTMKISFDGGVSEPLAGKPSSNPLFSPDGEWVVYRNLELTGSDIQFEVMNFAKGEILKTITLPPTTNPGTVRWSPDGNSLSYVDTRNNVSNIWQHPIDGGSPKQITHFQSDIIFSYAWARDGKSIIVSSGSSISDVVLISDFR
jgi:eukaryotic-like serine/threonine-protein kinase